MGKTNSIKRNKIVKSFKIPEEAKLILLSNPQIPFNILERHKKAKYSKKFLVIVDGHDILENSIVIRPYIQRKYNITLNILEILLCLYPKQTFTYTDYQNIPKQFSNRKLKYFIDKEYVVVFSQGKLSKGNLYCLSKRSKQIVTDYYKYLSGEKEVETKIAYKKNITPSNQELKNLKLIEKLNTIEPSALKKSLFQ